MNISNGGRGIHQREIPGLDKLRELPDNWHAFTNLDLSLPGKGIREIDVVIVLEDRILLIDLKDWRGPITCQEGLWFNGSRDCGRSPVGKIAEIGRDLAPLLKKFLSDQERREGARGLGSPRIDSAVVLSRVTDRSGIAQSEVSHVFSIDPFIKMVRNRVERVANLGSVASKYEDFTSQEWMGRFKRFFNTTGSIFRAGTRKYGGYSAKSSESPTFQHLAGIFSEFDVEEDGIELSAGLLRRWDFTKADTRFQSEDGRATIAGRERSVIAWLDDRNPKCGEVVFRPKVEDPERGVSYWEVFDRRRRMKRLVDFQETELPKLTPKERVEVARQALAAAVPMHDLKAAHLDIGSHSVWVELPTSVKFSHLMAASLPEVMTLGDSRFQFLSSSRVPEDILGGSNDPIKKDVFLLGCVVHRILFGVAPAGDPPEWAREVDAEGVHSVLHPWFERCLDVDQAGRYENASKMLNSFNAAVASVPNDKATTDGLERYRVLKSQRQVFQKYPEKELVKEDDRILVWRSEVCGSDYLIKLWKASSIGELSKERPRVLSFLERARSLIESPLRGTANVVEAIWTGDAIAVVQAFVPGGTLAEVLKSESIVLSEGGTIRFLELLVHAVENLHARSSAHGDIKPENIVVSPFEDGQGHQPVLIDLLDFSCSVDGERISRAYAPASGGRFERDRFAVTKVVEEILAVHPLEASAMRGIARAIEECRSGSPANGTLLPLQEAIDLIVNPKPSIDEGDYKISIVGAAEGQILSDEGRYWISQHGPNVRIRGAAEELFITLDAQRRPLRAKRSAVLHSAIQRLKRYEVASFAGAISVQGATHGLSAILEILDLPEVARVLSTTNPVELRPDEDAESDIVGSEEREDYLSERIDDEAPTSPTFSVPHLWRRLVEIEADLRSEVVALGDSAFRPQNGAHVTPVQVTQGSVEFDRRDVVHVERLDSHGRWIKIGVLDQDVSTADFLAISSWMDAKRGPIVQDGDHLRFQSRFENTSRQRREEAVGRILRRASAAPDLIDAFDPSARAVQKQFEHSFDENAFAERYGLNPSQVTAFKLLLGRRPMGLLQGPPGTGKTRFIGALVHFALTHGLARNVLVASQSHEAVNNAAEAVLRLFGRDRDELSMIRVGSEGSISEVLRPYHAAKVETAYKDRFVATARRRMEVAGAALGLSESESDAVMYYEYAVQPVLNRIAELAGSVGAESKLNELKSTVEQLLAGKGIDANLTACEHEQLADEVSGLYFSRMPGEKANKVERLRHVVELGRDIAGTVSTWERSFETFLAGTRQVVAGTCVGLGRTSLGLTKTAFDLVIVDEAARCTSSELAVPIQAGRWVVLVGDHAQLEPLHPTEVVESLAQELDLPLHEVVRSDFERVFESPYGSTSGFTLKRQYRMLPPIGRLVSGAFYDRALQHGRDDEIVPSALLPDELRLPLVWVCTDSSGPDAYQSRDPRKIGSLVNRLEADVIVSLIRRWSESPGFVGWLGSLPAGEHAIGIICGYAAQRDLVWRKLQAENLPEAIRRRLKVDTIDSYQGKENLIVLLSLVRNNSDGPKSGGAASIAPGFMSRKNRINVALSRAMDRLVIVGAKAKWREGTPLGSVSDGFDEEVRSGAAEVLDGSAILAWATQEKKQATKKSKAAGRGA